MPAQSAIWRLPKNKNQAQIEETAEISQKVLESKRDYPLNLHLSFREEPDQQQQQPEPVRQRPECCHRVPHLDDTDDGISNERSDEPLLGRHRQQHHHQHQHQQFNHYYYNWDVSEDSGNVTNSSTENQSSTSGNQANQHRRSNKGIGIEQQNRKWLRDLAVSLSSFCSFHYTAFSYSVTYDDLWDGRSFIRHLPNVDGQTFSEADEECVVTLFNPPL